MVPAVVPVKNPTVPEIIELKKLDCKVELSAENQWCEHVYDVINVQQDLENSNEEPGKEDRMCVSWAAYHANHQDENKGQKAISTLLPLFPDDSKSVAMIKHSMDVVHKAVNILNKGQIPVIACDQPLYKIAKDIQWTWPEMYGEEMYVVMLGGLHIKMALLKCLGDLLDGSGWISAILQAGIASPGTAESVLKVSHVKKAARAHQVTVCALYKLQQDSYRESGTALTCKGTEIKQCPVQVLGTYFKHRANHLNMGQSHT